MKSTSFAKKAFTLGAMTVLSAGAFLAAPAAQAATYYDLDFEKTSANATTNAGADLNPFLLDSNSGQYGFGTTSSKTSIGDIWLPDGISITGYQGNYITNQNRSKITLGLFDSSCSQGTNTGTQINNNGKCERRINRSIHGDNDLATGISAFVTEFNADGTIKSRINTKTPDLGNLLIFEENPGNATPDDTANGGTFVFDFANALKKYSVEKISVVDDADVDIKYYYADGTTSEEGANIVGENEVGFFSSAEQKQIAKVAVRFQNSGGIGGIRLKEIVIPTIPEPTAVLGLIAFGAVAARLKRKPQATEA